MYYLLAVAKINTVCKSLCSYPCIKKNLMYRVIHKSLRNFRNRLRNNQDRHGRKEHINRERETLQVSVLPYRCSICAPLLTSEGSWQTFLAHARQSQPMGPDGLFVSQRKGIHSAGISCTIHELFCLLVVLCGTWSETSVAPSQLTQFRQIPRHRTLSYSLWAIFRHDYPLAVEPASTPRPQVQIKTWRDSLPIDMVLSAVSVLVVAQSSSEIPEGLMNNPVLCFLLSV